MIKKGRKILHIFLLVKKAASSIDPAFYFFRQFFFRKILCLLGFPFLFSCTGANLSSDDLIDVDTIEEEYYLNPFKRDSLRNIINDIRNDSVKKDINLRLAYHYYKNNDSVEFRYWNGKGFSLFHTLKDTLGLAESHWDLGNFLKMNEEIDSAFYHYKMASSLYEMAGNRYYSARMMLNLSIIQQDGRDYTGSEITTFRAISIIKPLKEKFQLYIAYNILGINFNELEEYERSLSYHERALKIATELSDPYVAANSLNNIGVVYKNSGDYLKAIELYKKALDTDSLTEKNPRLFATLHDNIAYASFKAKTGEDIEKQFLFALHLRDSLDHKSGIATNKIHLGEYYAAKGDTLNSIRYLKEANSLAKEIGYNRDYLESLLFLAAIDQSNSEERLLEYILVNDSLQTMERNIRNKFARIQFETDEFIAENEFLTQQRQWIMGGGTAMLLVVVLLFVIRHQKINNKKLQLEQAQQKANEDIYNLLLEQENKIEEGRSEEKERISRDLHDGVLSKMFGIRFLLGGLLEKRDESSILKKKNLIVELRLLEEEIRKISHDLGSSQFPEQAGFLTIVEKFLEEQRNITNFIPLVVSDEELKWEKIPNRIKINLYKILQEAVQNINKYAEATEVYVTFEKVEGKLKITISDNGQGFAVEKKSRGIGLKNMRSRTKALQGSILITSEKTGTKIEIELPIDYE